jgi:hypothetical protein
VSRTASWLLLWGLLSACASAPTRGPEQLRAAYAQALRDDDPDAAYELLAEPAKSRISREAFRERWAASAPERARQLAAIDGLDRELSPAVMTGVTTHAGGRILHWVHVDGAWLVLDGLPATPDTATPAAAVRSFVRALRTLDLGALSALVDPTLVAQLREEWGSRADRIERALEDPHALTLSLDLRRAVLRYGATEQIVLEHGEHGWRIIDFE